MKHSIIICIMIGLVALLLCTLPNDPADNYSNAVVSLAVDSLTAVSAGVYIDTLGNKIHFTFYRKYSHHIDSFVVDFNDGSPVEFTTSDYPDDTLSYTHTFQSVGHKVLSLRIYYNNETTRFVDSLAIIDILNKKPYFMGLKADSVFKCDDSGSIAIPLKVAGGNTENLVYSITDQNLPESSNITLVGDTTLLIYVPENVTGDYYIEVQVADTIDSVRMTLNLSVTDNTPPFPPVFVSPVLVKTTTPLWEWATGGNGGCGIYRYNLDNDNLIAGTYPEKKTTIFQPPTTLSEGKHTLFIQERDSSGNWSEISSWAVTIDFTGPLEPVVSGTTPTNSRKPAWVWTGSNVDEPVFRIKLDSARFSSTDTAVTTAMSFTPETELSEGKHTLFVQERDEAGNWSGSGSFTINVDLTGPQAPTVTGTTPTANRRPVWTWTSNGGGGKGEFRCALDTNNFHDSSFATSALLYIATKDLSEGEHTFYVQEQDTAGNWSNSGSFAVLIDVTAPNPPVMNVAASTVDRTPTWTWTSGGGGNGTFRYKLDSDDLSTGATKNTAVDFTPPTELSEGLHTLFVQESDSTGNWSQVVSKGTVIDLTPPDAPVLSGSSLTNSAKPGWTWISGGDGIGTFRFTIDFNNMNNGTMTDTTAYTATSALSEDIHTFYVQEQDAAGNWSSLDSFATRIDLTPPAVPVVVGSAVSNIAKPTWSWSSGGGGNGEYRYKVDSEDLSSSAVTTTSTNFTPTTMLIEGEHTLYVQERDIAGNWSTAGSFTTKVDTTAAGAPVVIGESPTNDATPTWSWTSGGGSGKFRYKLDDSTLSNNATETDGISFTPGSALAEGTHTLYVQEDDGSGNWSPSGRFVIQIDLTPPSAPVVSGVTPTSNKRPVWTWHSVDGSGKFRYKFNSNDFSTGSTEISDTVYTPQTDLDVRAHTIYVQERDPAKNWSVSDSFTIVIDNTGPNAPTVSGTTPTNNRRPVWSWTSGGEGNGTYRYKLDDSVLTSGATVTTAPLQYQPAADLSVGTHTLYVQEQDNAENWSGNGKKAIVIDITPENPPVMSCSSPTNDNTPTWSWRSGGGKGYYMYRLDASNIEADPTYQTSPTSFTPSFALSEGTHYLYIKEQDAAGNWSDRASCGILIDLVPPNPPVFTSGTTPSPAPTRTVTWVWQSGGNGGCGRYKYKLDNGSWSDEVSNLTQAMGPLAEGDHTFFVQERDEAGNWSESSAKTVNVFPAPTNLTVSTYNSGIRFQWTDNSNSESGYKIYSHWDYYLYGLYETKLLGELGPNATSFTHSSSLLCPDPGNGYNAYYWVVVTRGNNTSVDADFGIIGCQ